MPTAPIVTGNRLGTPGRMGPIYQYGSAMPAGPYSFLPGGSTTRSTTTPGGSTTSHAGPTNEATDFYNSVLSGQQMPYTQGVQDSMLTDASDMTAAAETAQHQAMVNHAAANGGSAGDPSMQGSANEAAAARQAGNVKAKNDISMQADQANFGAKQNAASHLMDYDLQQQGFANGVTKTAMGFLPFNNSSGSRGGNNFTGGQGGLEYQSANLGTFNPQPAKPKTRAPNQYGQYQSDSYYEDMGL